MISQDSNAIYSEDYADLLINYFGDPNLLKAFPNAIYEIINIQYAIVHIPIQQITSRVIQEYGYFAMPKIFGLISHASLEASGIIKIRNIPNFNLRGRGVLLGIIDTGIDYGNPVFQNADGTTRIVSIWDQSIPAAISTEDLTYGTEYTRDQINQALSSDNPLSIVPSMDTNGHGTMVAGIAGGSENIEKDFLGVAPEAEFVVVKLKTAKKYLKNFFYIPEDALGYQENDIMYALDYILKVAFRLKMPLSICCALGTSQGMHSGTGALPSYFVGVAGTPGVAVTVAGGNEGNGRRHFSGIISNAIESIAVDINVGEKEAGFSMELWGSAPSLFSIDILSPSGEYISRIAMGTNDSREISFVFEETIIYIDFIIVEASTGAQLILMRFDKPTQGIWRFNVYEKSDIHTTFNIWLPMRNFISQNTFFINSDPYITILEPGNVMGPLTVTAYNIEDDSLYLDASRGYTVLNKVKPDVAAPGVNIVAPTLDQEFANFSGTSTSAAHTAGVAALLLEWGVVKGNLYGISTVEIKKLIQRGARRDINITYPNRDWGYGILDLFNVFDSLRTSIVV